MAGCPDHETLAEYLDGRLSAERREPLEAHLADCGDCRQLAAGAFAFAAEQEARRRRVARAPRLVPAWRAVAVSGAAAAVALAIGQAWQAAKSPRSLLVATEAAQRPAAPRLTGGFPWAPVAPARRADWSEDDVGPEVAAYLAAAHRLRLDAAGGAPERLGALGAADLLTGRLDAAVRAFERAVAADPESAALRSDLAAAYLARAERRGGAVDLALGLERVQEALALDGELAEARFNRALALERLHLPATARRAWQAFLELDGASPWAQEAAGRLAAIELAAPPNGERLRAELVAASFTERDERVARWVEEQRHLARRAVQEELLPAWGTATLAGELEEAAHQLRGARRLAESWQAQTADRSLLDAVTAVEQAAPPHRRRLADGYAALGLASRELTAFRLPAAAAAADRAGAALAATRSAAAVWAQLLRLACGFYLGEEIEQRLATLRDQPSDPASVGRAAWIAGMVRASRRGDLAGALPLYRDALLAYEGLGEVEPASWLRYLLSETYGYLGQPDQAWRHRQEALATARRLPDRERAFGILAASSVQALFEGRPRVAAALLDELAAWEEFSEPEQVAQIHLWRCRVRLALGDHRGAREDLERASVWLARAEPLERRRLLPDLQLARGLLAEEPQPAIAAFSRALAGFEAAGEAVRLPAVLLERGRARLRAGEERGAEQDFRSGLAMLAGQDPRLANERLWAVRLDGPQRLIGELVALQLSRGEVAEAFAVAERGRGRVLLGAATGDGSETVVARPATLSELAAGLAPGTTMLYFMVTGERVVRWRIDRGGYSCDYLSASTRELTRLADALGADLAAGAWSGTTREVASRLHAQLIGEAGSGPSGGTLVVVPDGGLHAVPFVALPDPKSGRYLVEQRTVVVAPSAGFYLASGLRRRARPEPPTSVVALGEPDPDRVLFPNLAPLPGARVEAERVATLYPRRQLLLGRAATRANLLAAAERSAVLHLATHALSNPVAPERASLVLTGGGSVADAALSAADVADLWLDNVRAVVLTGCATAGGPLLPGEGLLSLTRAFLAAGVPTVVASPWPVPDHPVPLATALHRRLRRGDEPAVALRGAQLELLRGAEPALRSPAVWGAFQAFGG